MKLIINNYVTIHDDIYIVASNSTINVSKTLEFHGTSDFRVTLEWVPEDDLIYNVSVSPPPIAMALLGNAGAEMTLLYNTPYSVTIAALSPCGLNISTITLDQFNQSELGDCLILFDYCVIN